MIISLIFSQNIVTKFRSHAPLQPRGLASAPKFPENSQNKFLANEEENAYVQLEVWGDPAPSIAWFRGDIALADMNRSVKIDQILNIFCIIEYVSNTGLREMFDYKFQTPNSTFRPLLSK